MCDIIQPCQEYPWGQNSVQRVKTTHDDGDKIKRVMVLFMIYMPKNTFRKRGQYFRCLF